MPTLLLATQRRKGKSGQDGSCWHVHVHMPCMGVSLVLFAIWCWTAWFWSKCNVSSYLYQLESLLVGLLGCIKYEPLVLPECLQLTLGGGPWTSGRTKWIPEAPPSLVSIYRARQVLVALFQLSRVTVIWPRATWWVSRLRRDLNLQLTRPLLRKQEGLGDPFEFSLARLCQVANFQKVSKVSIPATVLTAPGTQLLQRVSGGAPPISLSVCHKHCWRH